LPKSLNSTSKRRKKHGNNK
jgi:hypothetical protein